jgi:catechol 2,3-dioxygenase-like lactoylglutathione lyase family enzyme
MPQPPKSLSFSHVGLYVRDLRRMRDFYVRVLGFEVTDEGVVRGNPIVFLSRDPTEHHQIVLVEGRTAGLDEMLLNQISLRVERLAELRDLLALIEAEPDVTDINPVSHGNAWSVYFRDPERNRIEVFVDAPWYVAQPHIEPLDLRKSDEEIVKETRSAVENEPSFESIDSWRERIRQRLESRAGS